MSLQQYGKSVSLGNKLGSILRRALVAAEDSDSARAAELTKQALTLLNYQFCVKPFSVGRSAPCSQTYPAISLTDLLNDLGNGKQFDVITPYAPAEQSFEWEDDHSEVSGDYPDDGGITLPGMDEEVFNQIFGGEGGAS